MEEFVECIQSGIRGFGEAKSAVDKSKSSPFGDSEGFESGGIGSRKYGMGVCHDRADTVSVDSAKKSAGATIVATESSELSLIHI